MRVRWMAKIKVVLLVLTFLTLITTSLLLILYELTIVYITVEGEQDLAIPVLCESRLKILFINSITGAPVELSFKLGDVIRGEYIKTDEATMEYYSSGVLDVESNFRSYESKTLKFCSMLGFKIRVENLLFKLEREYKGVCVELKTKRILDVISN
ncbi:MAG: hypothetical protein QXR02_07285 [Acidilobaceae archaeon]